MKNKILHSQKITTIKKIIIASLILSLFSFAKCHKDKPDSNGLPAATQEGKNTLGFLLNGQPWTPQGNNGTANLSIDMDFGFNQGVFGISSYRRISSSSEHIGFGIKDSLSFIQIPATLVLDKNSLYQFGISTNNCAIDYYDSSVYRNGSLTLNKLDKVNRIVSETFNAILYKNGCDTIKITNGRFDMKF